MKQTILTVKQNELLENLIVRYGQVVTTQQIYAQLKGLPNHQQATKLISRLVKNGWLIRIKRGLYAISDLSSRGFLSLSPYYVANLFVKKSYVSFELALTYYSMFDQLTSVVTSVSQIQHKTVKLNQIEYRFINVQDKFFFGWQNIMIDGNVVCIATAEKALIDIIHFHKSKYSIDIVIEKLKEYQDSVDMEKLIVYASQMSNSTLKIIGFILDLLDIDSTILYKKIKTKPSSTDFMLVGDQKFNAKWRLYYDEYFDKFQQKPL
jgi:predicted transcriptional regulator of viral defense system